MNPTTTAWLAGIFEGEGCISFTGQNSVCLDITMTDRLANCRRQGYCKRGHRMFGKNLYVSPGGSRQCRTCSAERELTRQR